MKFKTQNSEDSLELYRTAIERLAESKDPMQFFNSGAEHASIVIANIFKQSQNEIYMFSGNLNGSVSSDPEYLKQCESFLSEGGHLNLILEEKPSSESKAFKVIERYMSCGNINISVLGEKNREELLAEVKAPMIHLMVGDGKMYRLETDTAKYKAQCSFNDPSTCQQLRNIYSFISRYSQKLEAIA